MPVRVNIPIRLRVDPRALIERQADIEEALAAAVGRALGNSRDVVLEKRGGYVGVRVHPPEFTWTGDGLTGLTGETRIQTEDIIVNCLAQVVTFSDLLGAPKSITKVYQPISPDLHVAEPLDLERLYATLGVYEIPSYDQRGTARSTPIHTLRHKPHFRDEWIRLTPGRLTRQRMQELSRNATLRWGLPTYPRGLILREAGGWEIVIWPATNTNPLSFTFENFGRYQYRQGRRYQVYVTPPPGQATAKRVAIESSLESRRQTIQDFMGEQIRSEIVRGLKRPATMRQVEYEQQLESRVTEQIEQLAGSIPSDAAGLIQVHLGSNYVLLPVSALDDTRLRWEGTANLLPITHSVEISPTTPQKTGSGAGQGDGTIGVNSGTATTSDNGSGKGGIGVAGSVTGEGSGDGQPQEQGGFVYTGSDDSATATSQFFPAFQRISFFRDALVCESFQGEPSIAELGSDGEQLKQLMNEIAHKLQIPSCEFAGQFCHNAAKALGSRALDIGSYAVKETGSTRQVTTDTGNFGSIQFVPTASPAIQFMRHLAGVTPLISDLSRTIYRIYQKSEYRTKIRGHRQNDPVGWYLDFLELVPLMEEAVGYLFVMTCRVLLLQLLRVSHEYIQTRLLNFKANAPLFEKLVLTQLADVDELIQLRDRLKTFQQVTQVRDILTKVDINIPGGIAIVPGMEWFDATRLVTEAITTKPNDPQSAQSSRNPGEIVTKGGISRIRDRHNTLWTLVDLESAIATRRGLAEDIDPLVKQITDIPEVMERFRIAEQFGFRSEAIQMELSNILNKMKDDNEEITSKVTDDWRYAFKASQIQESLPAASIPGTSFALHGIHLQAHEQIGEFFQGCPYYPAGINALFNARLGQESLTSFFEFTGLVLLAIICPPAAAAAGILLAAYQYDLALEKETLYGALIDPESVISHAEVEAELFAAKLGLALAFIPEVGSILKVGSYGVKAVSRAGLAGGSRLVGRYVARRITSEMLEALSRNLAITFAKEVATNLVMDKIMEVVMEPIIKHIEREATITGAVGGSQGAEMVRQMLAEEQQAIKSQSVLDSSKNDPDRRKN
jgi:hypothetical protein